MEGLIPLLYKTLKKNKTRRQYECLSSGAAQSYNIADFYVAGQSTPGHVYMKPSTAERIGGLNTERNGHRRHVSMGDFSMGYSSADGTKTGASPTPVPKIMRFGSHRMFSCVTGA